MLAIAQEYYNLYLKESSISDLNACTSEYNIDEAVLS